MHLGPGLFIEFSVLFPDFLLGFLTRPVSEPTVYLIGSATVVICEFGSHCFRKALRLLLAHPDDMGITPKGRAECGRLVVVSQYR